MRPICESCLIEMHPQGLVSNLGYVHANAPVERSRGKKYTCPDCNASVYLPIGYASSSIAAEDKDYIPVRSVVAAKPEGKLP